MNPKFKIIFAWLGLIILIVVLSWVSVRMWGGKPEEAAESHIFVFQEDETIAAFGERNQVPNPVLKEAFQLATKADLQKPISELNLTEPEMTEQLNKALALNAEYESKNWFKIPLKFAAWFVFLLLVFFLLRAKRVRPVLRKWLYFAAALIFGVALSSDPSPMGTVKDAIVLLGAKGVIFPPRLIAMLVFLALVLVANKFICAWGCQLGVLQDLIFRFNRNTNDTKGKIAQIKIPFIVSNSIRVLFFLIFSAVAFLWAFDLIGVIDPFKVYNPAKVGLAGGIFIGILLSASLFIYRPWCHLFCPFGLVGWLVEKISIFKIKVDYDTCIACEKCAKACPSTVMNAILKREETIPDCFACGNCIDVCPTDSIHFQTGKRALPPAGKFESDKR